MAVVSAIELTRMLVDVPISVQVPPSMAKNDRGIIRALGLICLSWLARSTMGMNTATAAVLLMNADTGAVTSPIISTSIVVLDGARCSSRSPRNCTTPLDCSPALSTNMQATVTVAGFENPDNASPGSSKRIASRSDA